MMIVATAITRDTTMTDKAHRDGNVSAPGFPPLPRLSLNSTLALTGPVLVALPFDGEDDLIAQANDSVYGLACGLWTADYKRAWRVARAIDAGTIWINTYKQLSIAAPFGGFKQRGIGREKGLAGLRLYQQAKSLYWGLDD